jgi:hypothetical protein
VANEMPLARELAEMLELGAFPSGSSGTRHCARLHSATRIRMTAVLDVGGDPGGLSGYRGMAEVRALAGDRSAPRDCGSGGVVAGFGIYALLNRAVHRWAARPALREELSKLGIAWPRR